ncbi:hypothetical protein PPYR_08798 [Photinus pyralis]|uniref:Carboxylic ester hydrolase n=1 Tax=Photinus pyralis TaxID=7054 RepID=A0A5N4AKB8_PHOPY|nr:venom carboxylesterase-6-like [Photinus pyralis]KAB0797805.1 hypothetical protein PPYR_08798 [Photinus pyralis]
MSTFTKVCLLLLINGVSLGKSKFQVQLQQGVLEGSPRWSSGGREFVAFEGIPYAEPPLGDKRFQGPVAGKPWNGVLNATRCCPICPQSNVFINDFTPRGDENCLCLNVYTAQEGLDNLVPVIFYIHGGGFMTGSGDPYIYGPDILLDHNLVVVTFNYRIGALGFLSFEDEVLPGNNGLKDQSLALRWVKDNIKHFGGDPDKITIYGNSAGSASVYHHLLSPLSKGLIHGAISSSGIATATWAVAQKGEAKRNALRLAAFLNCPTSSSEIALECLRKVSAQNIVLQNAKFMEFLYEPSIPHKPVIEPELPGAFLTKLPLDIIKSGGLAQVPYINGITTDDGTFKSAAIYDKPSLVDRLNKEFDRIVPMILHYDHLPSSEKISKKVRAFYLQNRKVDNTTKAEVTNMITDALFHYPQRVTSQLHAKYSKRPVYFYLFGYRGSVSFSTIFGDKEHDYGVCHGDDTLYSISNELFHDYQPSATDLEMKKIMSTFVYNFANTGDPTSDGNNPISEKWEPVENAKFKYLSIKGSSDVRMEEKLFEDRFEFWKRLNIHYPSIDVKDEL